LEPIIKGAIITARQVLSDRSSFWLHAPSQFR
jgi:hypothetical protein